MILIVLVMVLRIAVAAVEADINCKRWNESDWIESEFFWLYMKVYLNFTVTEFYKMPNLYDMEPYDRCMHETKDVEAVYCMLVAAIQPNQSNPTWTAIEVSFVCVSVCVCKCLC